MGKFITILKQIKIYKFIIVLVFLLSCIGLFIGMNTFTFWKSIEGLTSQIGNKVYELHDLYVYGLFGSLFSIYWFACLSLFSSLLKWLFKDVKKDDVKHE